MRSDQKLTNKKTIQASGLMILLFLLALTSNGNC